MKKLKLRHLFIVAATMGIVVTGCKKDDDTTPSPTSPTSTGTPTAAEILVQTQNADDVQSVETQTDESMDDVNAVLNNSSLRGSITGPCNATIDTSQKASGIVTIDYNGLSCDLKKVLSGSITIQLPASGSWSDSGVTAGITYNNFKVSKLTDSTKSVTFNGSFSVTNVTGGNIFTIGTGDSVVHKTRGSLDITFANDTSSTTRTWGVATTKTFYNDGGFLNFLTSGKVKITGDTTINGNANVARWGTNRRGEDFSVSITTPITIQAALGTCLVKQMTGEQVYRNGGNTLTITHGVDSNGNVVTDGSCTYGYKMVWTDDQGNTKEAINPYFF